MSGLRGIRLCGYGFVVAADAGAAAVAADDDAAEPAAAAVAADPGAAAVAADAGAAAVAADDDAAAAAPVADTEARARWTAWLADRITAADTPSVSLMLSIVSLMRSMMAALASKSWTASASSSFKEASLSRLRLRERVRERERARPCEASDMSLFAEQGSLGQAMVR